MPLIGQSRPDRFPGEDTRIRRALGRPVNVPYLDAVYDVDLGAHSITAGTGLIVGVDAATNTAGTIKLWGAGANDFYTTITAAEQTTNATYVLPIAMPTANDRALICSTAGVFSWNDQAVKTTSSPTFAGAAISTITLASGSITSSTGAISFGNENLSTTGIITAGSITDGTTLHDATSGLHVYGTATTDYAVIDTGVNFDFVTMPDNPTLALIETAGNVDEGKHYYQVSFTTAFGETDAQSYGSAPSVTTDATHKQVTVTIPVSTDYRVTGRKIYRTKAGDAAYKDYLLVTVANNVDTEYVDNISDATLEAPGRSYLYTKPNLASKMLLKDGSSVMTLDAKTTQIGVGAGLSGKGVTIGSEAGQNLESTGAGNVLVGHQAGRGLTSGTNNEYIGLEAGIYATGTTSYNVGIGQGALQSAGGSSNVAVGHNAGRYCAGYYNVLLGYKAGYSVSGSGAIQRNTCIGDQAGYFLRTPASYNQLIGMYSGDSITDGDGNVLLGYNTDVLVAGQDFGTAVGHLATVGASGIALGYNVSAAANEFAIPTTITACTFTGAVVTAAGFAVGASVGIDATVPVAPVDPDTVAGSMTFTKGILTAYTAPS